jgi:hypothetical protein
MSYSKDPVPEATGYVDRTPLAEDLRQGGRDHGENLPNLTGSERLRRNPAGGRDQPAAVQAIAVWAHITVLGTSRRLPIYSVDESPRT